METHGTIQERVARGAAWLDEVRPGWRDAVKLDKLLMSDTCQCICGQVFAAEVDAAMHDDGYDYALAEFGDYDDWDVDHGFCTALGLAADSGWLGLEDEWRRVIHASRVPADLARA